jgi:hypothetical protein
VIDVKVSKDLKENISSFSYNYSLNILKFQFELYNTGSIPYKSRIRIDILNDSQEIFTGWSDEKSFMPGDKENFKIYWYTNSTGNFTARTRVYFANEILDQEYNFKKNTSSSSQNIFEVKNFRTYDNFIIFDVRAKKDAINIIVIPSGFTPGWVFEQKEIDSIKKNTEKSVILKYNPTVWTSGNLTLLITSDEGRYYTEKTLELKKETGIKWLIYYIIDNLKLFLNSKQNV